MSDCPFCKAPEIHHNPNQWQECSLKQQIADLTAKLDTASVERDLLLDANRKIGKQLIDAVEAVGDYGGRIKNLTAKLDEANYKLGQMQSGLDNANMQVDDLKRLLAQGLCGVPGHLLSHCIAVPLRSFICTACAAIAKAKDDALVEASDLSCFGCGRNLTYSLDRLRRPL